MTYVLLWFALNVATGSMAGGSAEFNTLEACNSAARHFEKISKGTARTVCLPKGDTFP